MPFNCDRCDTKCANASALRSHRSSRHPDAFSIMAEGVEHHVSMVDGKFRCPVKRCAKTYKGRDGLRKHAKDQHPTRAGDPTLLPFTKQRVGLKRRPSSELSHGQIFFPS